MVGTCDRVVDARSVGDMVDSFARTDIPHHYVFVHPARTEMLVVAQLGDRGDLFVVEALEHSDLFVLSY